jgi:hypothetical protein
MSLSFTNEQVVWNNSIYIPTIYKSIRKEDLVEFLEKDFGKVSSIDFVDLNENCRRVFVHFSEWYMDKGFGRIVRHNIETRGFCEFSMPIPNKYRKWFEGKMLINKNPLSPADRKIKKFRELLDISFERIHNLDNTVNDLKSKVSYLEDKLEEVLSKYEEPYDDKGPMDISELPADYKDIYKIAGKTIADFDPFKTWTEYLNRLLGVLLGIGIVSLFIKSFSLKETERNIPWFCGGLLFLIIIQGGVGALVVSSHLKPFIITIHMFLAILEKA